jgi:hypothetical protein
MENNLEYHIRRLWLAYKAYHDVSCKNGSDGSQYATESTNGYLNYLRACTSEGDAPYDWGDWSYPIENQIRILVGFIGCYDKPIKRDKVVLKTRWSL